MSPHLEDASTAAADASGEHADLPWEASADSPRPSLWRRHCSKKRLLLIGLAFVAAFAVTGVVFQGLWATSEFDGLEEHKQDYIWKCEHVAFELETHFGQPFTKALTEQNAAALRRYFQEPFTGRTLDWTGGQTRRHGIVSEVHCQAQTANRPPLGTDAMVEYLLALAKELDQTQRVSLRVLHNDLVDEASGQWELRLLLNLVGTADGGPSEIVCQQRVLAQFANDEEIKAGRIIRKWEVDSQVRRRSEKPLMEEVTQSVGLADLPLVDNWKSARDGIDMQRQQIAVEDFDRDGDLDIALATHEGEVFLLRSVEGQRFENAAQELGLSSPWGVEDPDRCMLAVWFDYDNDGYPDVLLGKRLYHNERGKKFVDVTDTSGLRIKKGSYGAVVADYDCDGRLDLYVLYAAGVEPPGIGWVGDDISGAENELWHNQGVGRFRHVTAAAAAGGGRRRTFAAAWLFLDEDALPDLYIANDFGTNVMLRNRGDGTFEDITRQTGTGDFATSMGVAAGDLDNDGTPEIYVANMYSKMGRRIIAHVNGEDYPPGVYEQIKGSCAGNRLYRKRPGQERFEETSEAAGINAVGWAFAPAMGDLDGDGLLDLYATTGYISVDRGKPDG